MERNCINICSISGPQENIEKIDRILNDNFSMNLLVPVSKYGTEMDRIIHWGCEEDIDLITYISCNFCKPQTIDMVYATDMPNLLFLRTIAKEYNLEIEHAFNNEAVGYIGYNKIIDGDLVEIEYEEDETSEKYYELQKKYNFINQEDLEEKPKIEVQKIISMKDILEISKNK